MRTELISHDFDWVAAWDRATSGNNSEQRWIPYTPPGQKTVLLSVSSIGGLALLYMPPEEIWLLVGHMKLVFSVAEWELLVSKVGVVIETGRANAGVKVEERP